MSYTLQFVEDDLSTSRLSLDGSGIEHIEEASSIPLPEHVKTWAENMQEDGKRYVAGKYDLVPVTLAFHISAASVALLDAKVRDLVAEITQENWLEFQPEGGTSLFYRTYPYDSVDPGTLQRKLFRLSKFARPFAVTLMAELPIGVEESLVVIHNELPNWSFEDYSGSGASTDFTGWTETRTNGSGTATVEADTSNHLHGAACLHLEITSADGVAEVYVTDAIEVDKDRHYCLVFNHRRLGGGDYLTATIKQYNSSHGDLSADIDVVPSGENLWNSSTTVVNADGEGGTDWDADCAEIRVYFTVTGGAASWLIDAVALVDSEYLSDYKLSNPDGVVIPASSLEGDLPADVDIYIEKWSDAESWDFLHIGGRKNYDDDYRPWMENTAGTADNIASALFNTYGFLTVTGELLLNPSFEDFSGLPYIADWDNWTEYRETSNVNLGASTTYKVHGSYSVLVSLDNYEWSTAEGSLLSDFISVDNSKDYLASIYIWRHLVGVGSSVTFSVRQYSSASEGSYLSTVATQSWTDDAQSWQQKSLSIDSGDWNGSTTHVRIKIQADLVHTAEYVFWDLASFTQSSSDLAFEGSDYLNRLEGYVKPYIHHRHSVTQSEKAVTLFSKLTDESDNDITNWREEETVEVNISTGWGWCTAERFSSLCLPTSAVHERADRSAMKQALRVYYEGGVGAGQLDCDCLVTMPVDNGWLEVSSNDDQYLIIDSQSELTGVLSSLDGTIDEAVQLDSGYFGESRFQIDPQNGSNFAILVGGGGFTLDNVAQLSADFIFKYRPRYLVVAT